ncbi:PPOX class F420-dependent oxidoreductase [Nocardia panacis]|uniref:PPOX class F420-dependent oxidoreductase n=1 Tax=Nocardia panacis TaxID=2340916 RepID=A0A3A4KDN6_9NOCA|nr:PPOX class F420-dependent oxidoreductase [Nocardia panacis]RJO70995.1 PPOX class F420-dependent oxidoreductase [Nocardia panacis]
MTTAFAAIGRADYVLLTTYRKDGTPVTAPLWAVADAGKLYLWTPTDSWKIKRLRRNPAVTVQPCNPTGKPHGAVVAGAGRVLDAEETARVRKLLMRKYFVLGPFIILGSLLRRGRTGTVGIEVTPEN